MVSLYHGTNYEAAMDIMKNGFKSPDTIWTCSNKNITYFVKQKEDETAMSFAIDSAKVAAAANNSQSTSVCIFKIEMDENTFDEEMLPDTSCENMEDCYCIESKRLNNLIANNTIKIKAFIVEDAYNLWLRPFYLSNLPDYYQPKDVLLCSAIKSLESINIYDCDVWEHLYHYSDIKPFEYKINIPA